MVKCLIKFVIKNEKKLKNIFNNNFQFSFNSPLLNFEWTKVIKSKDDIRSKL